MRSKHRHVVYAYEHSRVSSSDVRKSVMVTARWVPAVVGWSGLPTCARFFSPLEQVSKAAAARGHSALRSGGVLSPLPALLRPSPARSAPESARSSAASSAVASRRQHPWLPPQPTLRWSSGSVRSPGCVDPPSRQQPPHRSLPLLTDPLYTVKSLEDVPDQQPLCGQPCPSNRHHAAT